MSDEEQKLEFVSDCNDATKVIQSKPEPWEAWDKGDMEAAYNELQELREENEQLKDEIAGLQCYLDSDTQIQI